MLLPVELTRVILSISLLSSATSLAWARSMTENSLSLSRRTTDGDLSYVTDSGICETTKGVHQMSGYINISSKTSMFFWFVEARNSPDSAPLVLWLNGGPGCSSLIGMFVENGPCLVNDDGKTTKLNPYSWNSDSNMLYLDSPIGSGFSFGTQVETVDDAASWAWRAFQSLFTSSAFSKFQGRKLVLATESYGAHFGPAFIQYFNDQSAKIDSGSLSGVKVHFSALSISDGKHDSLIQFKSYVDFASNAPGYGPLQGPGIISQLTEAFSGPGGCESQMQQCYSAPTNSDGDKVCFDAYNNCTSTILNVASSGLDQSDLTQSSSQNDAFPPMTFKDYLGSNSLQKQIGASGTFSTCNNTVQDLFNRAGDLGRSALPPLAQLADARFPILIWAGDLDIKGNWMGVHAAMVSMPWYGNQTLNSTDFANMTLSGQTIAAIKTVDNFQFARVYGAGHALPAFKPQAAQEIFKQFLDGKGLRSVSHASSSSSSSASSSSSFSLRHTDVLRTIAVSLLVSITIFSSLI